MMDLPSGELTFCHGKIHHAINGKIHYFDWAIFHCKLLVHQRVDGKKDGLGLVDGGRC